MNSQNKLFNLGYFPDPSLAGEDGLLAAGGTLDTKVLLEAYSRGIFPWYSADSPVLWWSPGPRMILFPESLKVSKSLSQAIRNTDYQVRLDTAFTEVMQNCAKQPRPGQEGTWISKEMIDAYVRLHEQGYAHSVEVFVHGKLVGGLYGVSLGRAFFGESMFHLKRDASKIALHYLVNFARLHDFDFIDAQQSSRHMQSLGAEDVSREKFLGLLERSIEKSTLKGKWDRMV